MKKILIILLSSSMFFLTSATILPDESKGPKIVIEEKLFDAKEVMQGEIVNHTFKVINTGDQPLEINRVNPG